MARQKKTNIAQAILNVIVNSFVLMSSFGKIFKIVGFEARIASKGLVRIIIFSVFFGVILASTWICILGLLFFYLFQLHADPYFALLLIILLNVLILVAMGLIIKSIKNQLLFPEARKELRGGVKSLLE